MSQPTTDDLRRTMIEAQRHLFRVLDTRPHRLLQPEFLYWQQRHRAAVEAFAEAKARYEAAV